tara:strand:+ start:390 stop:653 length:264 start_codon:yes stop_codon:yes gene_type:complete
MTQKQLIETVQQHHPNLTETQIRIFLNKALDEFCRKTRVLRQLYTFSSLADQRYYALDDAMVEVLKVYYDGYEIPRLVGHPEKMDDV